MFFPSTDDKHCPDARNTNKHKRKKKKRKLSAAETVKKSGVFKKKHRYIQPNSTMSSWAENFTVASTWQLKHQLAFWKAKALSLEYENKILHDIIRKNCGDSPSRSAQPYSKSHAYPHDADDIATAPNEKSESDYEETDEDEIEVSDEYIEFLQKNATFKEKRKRKSRAEEDREREELEANPVKPEINKSDQMKELYGSNWKKIAASEMTVQSHYIHESDKMKPTYWPNIPLNFG